LDIDGYEIEPWHWRYLGVDLSTELKNKNITIAEYYNENNK
jgi:zinc D-Ala-D-Ala carboxypeptidase